MSDRFFAVTKIISDEASVRTQEKLWRCESVTECISKAESDISDRCSQYARYGFSWRYGKPYPA